MKKLIFIICSLTLALSYSATAAYAQNGELPEYIPLEKFEGVNQSGSAQSLQETLNFAFKILFSIGGLIAVLTLIIGGVAYMMSDVVSTKSLAKKRIEGALWGLGLLAISWLILYTINPDLLKFNFDSNRFRSTNQTPQGSGNTTGSPQPSTNTVEVTIFDRDTTEKKNATFAQLSARCGTRGYSAAANGTTGQGYAYTVYKCK
mgnify:CR=1 FL=1